MNTSRLAGVVLAGFLAAGPLFTAYADTSGYVTTASGGSDSSLDGGTEGTARGPNGPRYSGAPADQLPPSSPGANPGVPLGPGH